MGDKVKLPEQVVEAIRNYRDIKELLKATHDKLNEAEQAMKEIIIKFNVKPFILVNTYKIDQANLDDIEIGDEG
jgi:hypothetical protein